MHNFFYDMQNLNELFAKITRDLQTQIDLESTRLLELQKQNPAIARNVIELIACGYSPDEAIVTTALKFDCSTSRVRVVYDCNRYARKTMLLYAKNYLIHTLKQKGFKMVDIAYILGCNKQTVYNYLKKDFIP